MSQLNMGARIFGLFLLILALLAGSIFWFDWLGLVDARGFFAPVLGLFGQKVESINADDPLLLDAIRLRKQEEALDGRFEELSLKDEELSGREKDFQQRLAELEEREKAHDEKESAFDLKVSAWDDRDRNLTQNARNLNAMPLADAVAILEATDDQLLIDTLRKVQDMADQEGSVSLVSTWMSRMKDRARVAELQRKMTLKPRRD